MLQILQEIIHIFFFIEMFSILFFPGERVKYEEMTIFVFLELSKRNDNLQANF